MENEPTQDPQVTPPESVQSGEYVAAIVQVPGEQLTYESIKTAIYQHSKSLYERKLPLSCLKLGKDIYEILNKRLVFRTPAHKDLPHFITPFGSLRVPAPDEALDPDCFVID